MKEKLIGNKKNGFPITVYDNRALTIQEFLNDKYYNSITLSEEETKILKNFLREEL